MSLLCLESSIVSPKLLLNERDEDKYVIIATHDPAVYNKVDVIIDMKDIGDNV